MDLEDLFDGKHRRSKRRYHGSDHDHDRERDHDHSHDEDHHHDRYVESGRGRERDGSSHGYEPQHDPRDYRHGHRHRDDSDLLQIGHRLLANKKLLVLAAVVALVLLALAAFFLLPLLGQAVDYIDKTGVKGVVDRVWQGEGGGK
jgi:hypothetical protein